MDINSQFIVSSIAAVAAVVAAGVSIYNARFGRFSRQRWWERKVDAYSQIIDALSSLVYYYEEHMNAELECRKAGGQHSKGFEQFWHDGNIKIKTATAIGAFLISKEAETALQIMWKEKGKGITYGDWYGAMESDYNATNACLKTMVIVAKKDLGT